MSFSTNLKALLDVRDMQIKELSAKTGISKNTLDNYLSGQKSFPNVENAVKIAKALKTSVEFLVTGENSAEADSGLSVEKYKRLFASIYTLDTIDVASVTALVNSMQRRYSTTP